ncbi:MULTISPECIES: ribulose-phosphate 3-epimerase [Staphylococcus]|uniref:Ribulose-phosphate 3-epimerase n=3 Tax=Staphylococcus haemolyticus TaxID=1283 RepID=A0A2K0A8K6_STAHA|nr:MULTISPECIES: ribulose-phosphate 3-epimerase [Staphylococcus]MBY6179169.1 ribulose-phosphate 3-epimerase [Staphylococcaceae bacterium DP2N0-1]KGF25707.1 ribulose-phosphate 3-epimerase [Staphylococcus haemolyticus DNF00585]MCE0454719.1 ribulose-phosphate 3-epimerase [Staphylococcus haemolyticus]MCH4355159.1 ribulose-phosphate 3-epimerase [Staphylococcus haemolyticus]MCH4390179.1 ribulose-phosphate 3-epimerase [Staphylococcus haemolyticus]
MKKIYPSLLSADFLNLENEIKALEEAQIDGLHFDVMDGQFVPNISIGIPILDSVRAITQLPIDVHLMIEQPEQYINTFAEHGADMISIHVEATQHIHRALQMIKNAGKKAGVVINPGTPVESLLPVLEIVDFVLVMTVNPGFGGQSFIEACAAKVKILRDLRQSLNLNFNIEVDGGINNETIKICADNGADMFVTGSYFFKQKDYGKVTQLLKG